MVAIAAAGLASWFLRPLEGFIVGILPISDDEAFVLMRANYDTGPSRGWAIRTHDGGRASWTTELPDVPIGTGPGHGLVTDGRVLVAVTGDPFGGTKIVALDAATGAIRWQTWQGGTPTVGLFLRANEVVITYESPHGAVVRGLSLADGHRVWTHRPPEDVGVARLSEDRSRYVYRAAGWRVIALDERGANREARNVPISGDVCLVDRTLYGISHGQLVRADVAASTSPPRVERVPLTTPAGLPASLDPEATMVLADTCGQFGDDLVFVGHASGLGVMPMFLLVVDRSGIVRRRVELGAGELLELGGERDRELPAYHPLRGTLSPFAPMLIHRGHERGFELVVVDLARGALAWTSAAQPELLHYQVIRGKHHVHYLARTHHVVAIDGRTGHVLAAIESSGEGLRGSYASGRRLWEIDFTWSRMDELPFMTVDARTLARVDGANEALPRHDSALARTLAWLAVPAPYR